MFATAVGLIMKGVSSKNAGSEIQEEENGEDTTTPGEATIQGGTRELAPGFFEKIKKFFDEDTEGVDV